MKIKMQRTMFPNKELRNALSKDEDVSRKRFAGNICKHENAQTLIPLYLQALEAQVGTRYEKDARGLLTRFIVAYKKQKLELPGAVTEQIVRVQTVFKSAISKAYKKLNGMLLPLSEFAAKAKDYKYIEEMKAVLHVFTKYDAQIRDLRVKLLANKALSHDAARIVDVPGCQKTLLVPHPHTDSNVAIYYQSVLEHKAPVLISLCSPYEHQEIIPFWEGREVQDSEGRTITCQKLSEKVLYQGPEVAVIRDENRAALAREVGGVDLKALFPRIIERRLLIECADSKHETVHLHYENWPDHQEAPDIEALEVLFDHKDSLAKPDDIVMVNCKATIGRSGVFFYSDCGRRRVTAMADAGVAFSDMKLNFADMVRQVRRFRPILSGNPYQMGQIFEVIAKHYDMLQAKQEASNEPELTDRSSASAQSGA